MKIYETTIPKIANSTYLTISLDQIDKLSKGDSIIIRSHGVSKEVMDLLESKGIVIIDETWKNAYRKERTNPP